MTDREFTPDEIEKLDYAAEVFLDFLAREADGKEDHQLVWLEERVEALAKACGLDYYMEIEPMTAGEIRRNVRSAKRALAEGDGP